MKTCEDCHRVITDRLSPIARLCTACKVLRVRVRTRRAQRRWRASQYHGATPPPQRLVAVETQVQRALAQIAAARQAGDPRWQIDGWAQKAGCAGWER
jgi:hypothetical protein